MIEVALFVLSLAVLVLTVACAVLAASVPFLWWRTFRIDAKVEALDEVLSETLRAAGADEPLPPEYGPRGKGPMNEVPVPNGNSHQGRPLGGRGVTP